MSPTSLYIHWPFCESKCPYCDFNSHVTDRVEYERWLAGYLRAIDYYSEKLETRNWKLEARNSDNEKFQFPKKISSIFFGGGTPSLMKPEMVFEIIQKAKQKFDIADDIEITLEANPSSFETEKFKAFKDAGINRVSIGVQSFDESALKFLGRRHDKNQAIHAIEQAGKIFGNFSFDLIYALPNQTLESWRKELDFALQFNTPHLSLYQLTIEKGTPFYADFHKGKFNLPEEDLQTDLYIETVERCAKAGLERYEISNFAKRGYESEHNMNYWLQNDYIGIGPGAHGRLSPKLKDERLKVKEKKNPLKPYTLNLTSYRLATMDIHHPENWLKAVEENGHGTQSTEILSPQEIFEELIFMGLRIRDGISLQKLEAGNWKLETGKEFAEFRVQSSFSRPVIASEAEGERGNLESLKNINWIASSQAPRNDENNKLTTYNLQLTTLLKKLCTEGLMIIDEKTIKLTPEGMLKHTAIVKKILDFSKI